MREGHVLEVTGARGGVYIHVPEVVWDGAKEGFLQEVTCELAEMSRNLPGWGGEESKSAPGRENSMVKAKAAQAEFSSVSRSRSGGSQGSGIIS